MEAAGAVDAKNAPTAPWKTRRRVSHSYHRPSSRELNVNKCYPCSRLTLLPMFPVAPSTSLWDRERKRIRAQRALPEVEEPDAWRVEIQRPRPLAVETRFDPIPPLPQLEAKFLRRTRPVVIQ